MVATCLAWKRNIYHLFVLLWSDFLYRKYLKAGPRLAVAGDNLNRPTRASGLFTGLYSAATFPTIVELVWPIILSLMNVNIRRIVSMLTRLEHRLSGSDIHEKKKNYSLAMRNSLVIQSLIPQPHFHRGRLLSGPGLRWPQNIQMSGRSGSMNWFNRNINKPVENIVWLVHRPKSAVCCISIESNPRISPHRNNKS